MSQQYDTPYRRFVAGGAIPQYSLVQFASTKKVTVNGLATRPIGVAMQPAFVDGDEITVKLLSGGGTFKGIADEAIEASDVLYTEADGELQDTAAGTSHPIGIALEDAAAGAIFEWMPIAYGGPAAQ